MDCKNKPLFGGFGWFASCLFLCYAVLVSSTSLQETFPPPQDGLGNNKNLAYSGKSNKLLNVIQVSSPVKVPDAACTVKLMDHSFGWSYGHPFIGTYKPPDCLFNRVILTLTVTSAGRQFDRLALMYFNDTEVWRTSTAEPTHDGIQWTYDKDVSHLLYLFRRPQKLIFDLGNLVDNIYTGAFNTSLVATFYSGQPADTPADRIIPISKRLSTTDQPSAFRVPDEGRASSSLTIPRNARKAVFTISACGQAQHEEFWWSNAPSSAVDSFGPNATLPGASPFRELQLLIDGNLAGVAWPFPIIFTGGVVPGFWRPIVGIDAYDLQEDEIDITPWLPVLSDGKNHTYEIRVVGLADDGHGNAKLAPVGSNWIITGKIFLWYSLPKSVTTGPPPVVVASEPQFIVKTDVLKDEKGKNVTVNYHVLAKRELFINNTIITAEGAKSATWSQNLTFSNIGNITAGGNNQTNKQVTIGKDLSSEGYSRLIKYPLWCKSSTVQDEKAKSLALSGDINRGKFFQVNGTSVFPSGLDAFDTPGAPVEKGYTTNTTQEGVASYESYPAQNRTIGRGVTEQVYVFAREYGEDNPDVTSPTEMLYTRHILAENGKVLKDETITFVELDPQAPPPIKAIEDTKAPATMDVSGLDIYHGMGKKYGARLAGSSSSETFGRPFGALHKVMAVPPSVQQLYLNAVEQISRRRLKR